MKPEEIARNHGEVTFVEFRRRFDKVRATRNESEELWPQIDELASDIKETRNSKWLKFWGVIFFICVLANWWITPSGESKFSILSSVSISILIGYMLHLYFLSAKERELKAMHSHQRELLYKWEESGAQPGRFWSFRDLHRQKTILVNTPEKAEIDEWKIQYNEIEKKIEQLWYDVQIDLVGRAGADVPYASYLK